MKYIKVTCSNGFCGCNEEFYIKIEDEDMDNIAELATVILENQYSFYEPDGRFLTHASSLDDYDYEEDCAEYKENLSVNYEEITKEEYEKADDHLL